MCRFHAEDYIDFLQRFGALYIKLSTSSMCLFFSAFPNLVTYFCCRVIKYPLIAGSLLRIYLALALVSVASMWEMIGQLLYQLHVYID